MTLSHEAFTMRLSNLMPDLTGFAKRWAGADYQDLIQDTWVRCLESRHTYREDLNIRGWAFVTMRNVWLSQKRRTWRWVLPGEDMHEPSSEVDLALTGEHVLELHAKLSAVPESTRRMLIMAMMGDEYDKIATVTKVAIGTVKSRLARARSFLADEHAKISGISSAQARIELDNWFNGETTK